MREKEAIEQATACAFIEMYNSRMGTSFSIVEFSDAPDVNCKDNDGDSLNLEITLTEDRPGDIKASLGRSGHKSLGELKKFPGKVEKGEVNIFDGPSLLQGNVVGMIANRIQSKLRKDYGSNTALVIRNSSAVEWDWPLVVDQIKDLLNLDRNPFDKGIWIISDSKDRIFRLL